MRRSRDERPKRLTAVDYRRRRGIRRLYGSTAGRAPPRVRRRRTVNTVPWRRIIVVHERPIRRPTPDETGIMRARVCALVHVCVRVCVCFFYETFDNRRFRVKRSASVRLEHVINVQFHLDDGAKLLKKNTRMKNPNRRFSGGRTRRSYTRATCRKKKKDLFR